MVSPVENESATTNIARRSLHDRILEDVEGRIISGAWAPGFRIPFEHELMQHYGCSRMTVNKALTELARRGLIERRRKSGSYVLYPHSRSAVLEIHDIETEVAALGLPYRFDCLKRQQRKATATDRRLLDLQAKDQVLALQFLHFAGSKPFCVENRLISIAAVPEVVDETFEAVAPGRWLINRVPWSAAELRIRATGADGATAKLLGLSVSAACLVVERRTWHNDQYITHVCLIYSADSHELTAQFGRS